MTLEKAITLVGNYRKAGFKAGQALLDTGYSESMALKKSGVTLDRAYKAIAKHDLETALESPNPAQELFRFIKMSEYDIVREYREIIMQNDNFAVKLKALTPLLSEMGIQWNNDAGKTSAVPTLNLTVCKLL
ncbi:MAG: hypothetical protein WC237_02945 [Candidatus Paceibacterota bacterium]